jgi:hypothetical protein
MFRCTSIWIAPRDCPLDRTREVPEGAEQGHLSQAKVVDHLGCSRELLAEEARFQL